MADPALTGLAEPLRSRCAALLDEAGGAVRIVSGRRSPAAQMALRRAHCPDPVGSPASACRPPTAPVGRSKHETGQAVDLGGNLDLAARLAPGHQMHRTVPSEYWHYEAIGDGGRTTSPAPDSSGAPVGASPGLPPPPGGDGVAAGLGRLTSAGVWLRVAQVLGGAALILLGIAVITRDAWVPLAAAAAGAG